ncbi:sensor histidine kinase [Clostridium botulinum]|uniref:Sensor protein LytS n=1 Tax=Clostridium botulinum D str. 1873 TaxID=592027 RepID=A0A9P2LKL6_CLOBO|nr:MULTISPECIES: sensor histidine kinase [Clostridium]EES90580.1 sensor protein LytS [Clostridium botulinum D str. 1873]MBO3441517.1 sensor histidine kinase [Clostridium haemolyticum]MCD3217020.1 sensor histidine kinase [Clostridium botulinum C]NFV46573.1 sensor histidine kinase [Clostridium botulinum]QPW55690.1 sensor histidine kinase [Clostridium botulinum]
MVDLIKNLINNMGYFILIAFVLSQCESLKKIIVKDEFNKKDLVILSIVFGGFGILGTYIGTEIHGAIANTRIVGVMAGGILCGPFIGILSAIISGIHRVLIESGGLTAIPCAVTTVACGFIGGFLHKYTNQSNRWLYGLLGGLGVETLEMILILIFSKPFYVALSIVKNIYIPMGLANAVGISLLILLIENIFEEKEEIAAKQAKISLDIANKTLPYFREINAESFEKICKIIKEYIKSDAVAITDKKHVLAHVGLGADHHIKGAEILTHATEKVIKQGKILTLTNAEEINCSCHSCPLKSGIIVPLKERKNIIGTLKIYYGKNDAISFKNKNLAIGLSQIISTQLEISKIGKLKEMATKAEIKALQTQINPHFLFNSLNTIASFVRINPNKARDLIINLSTFLRYNLEMGDDLVDVYKELEQVKAYVSVEKARFGEKISVAYNIQNNIDIKMPSLIIQPIVENAIKHGILNSGRKGKVKISIELKSNNAFEVIVEDNGVGIEEEIIKKVYSGTMKENKIGISNVNNRLKLFYGQGLNIERLEEGTKVSFIVKRIKE